MKIYMKVTRDRFEFPVAIADTAAELARITGANVNTIRSSICHQKQGRNKNSVYREVEIGDWEK